MSEATQTPTLEQSLNKTDLGHVIFENRKIFFGLIFAVLAVVAGYTIYKQSKQSAALENSVKVFEFQNKTWAGAKEGKVLIPELVKQFNDLGAEIQASPVMVPVGLEIGKYLYEKNALDDAEAVLSKLNSGHPISSFFVSMQRSVILEKLGKLDAAVAVLEKLSQDKEGLMSPKVNLDLGRLSLLKGDKGKAQTYFNYILTTFPNDEHAKMAKLYLAKLAAN